MPPLRKRVKTPTSFVVFFECDSTWLIVNRPKVLSDDVPCVDQTYPVQWGTADQTSNGRIIGSGDYDEMRKLYLKKRSTIPPALTTTSKKRSANQVPTKAKKQKKDKANDDCKVLARVVPKTLAPLPTSPTHTVEPPEPTSPTHTAEPPEPTSASPTCTLEPTEPTPIHTEEPPEPTSTSPTHTLHPTESTSTSPTLTLEPTETTSPTHIVVSPEPLPSLFTTAKPTRTRTTTAPRLALQLPGQAPAPTTSAPRSTHAPATPAPRPTQASSTSAPRPTHSLTTPAPRKIHASTTLAPRPPHASATPAPRPPHTTTTSAPRPTNTSVPRPTNTPITPAPKQTYTSTTSTPRSTNVPTIPALRQTYTSATPAPRPANTPTTSAQRPTSAPTSVPRPTNTPTSAPRANTNTQTNPTDISDQTNMISILAKTIETYASTTQTSISTLTKKIDTMNRRIGNIEIAMKDLRSTIDRHTVTITSNLHDNVHGPIDDIESDTTDHFIDNIPPEYRVTLDELKGMQQTSKSPGNFALKLVTKFFPELFGPENLRYSYSFNGGGPKGKLSLEDTRKMIVKRYVLYFYPHLGRDTQWQSIVNTINEGLRRPLKKSTTTLQVEVLQDLPEHQEFSPEPPSSGLLPQQMYEYDEYEYDAVPYPYPSPSSDGLIDELAFTREVLYS